ncbi:hypothetical protein C8Q72DRAFT_562709 [Fomitopsis betulina]|nr:hypothetical protein C8Q72DRAFT_562709 [Fomitopsis betulina]
MSTLFAIYRYFSFAFFTACNIAICVIAAKTIYIALILKNGSILEIDALLIALGGVGLLLTFPILLIDVLRNKSVCRHVWFECLWVGIFCLLQSAGAGVATATMSSFKCLERVSTQGVPTYGTCVESTLILAFTWAAAEQPSCLESLYIRVPLVYFPPQARPDATYTASPRPSCPQLRPPAVWR